MVNANSRVGFTILEVLIVIGILSMVSAVIMPTSFNNTIRKKIEGEAQRITDVIELAKAKTEANDYGAYTCPVFDGYRVSFQPSNYQLQLCCRNSSASAVCSSPTVISQYTVDPDVTLTIAGLPLSGGYNHVLYKSVVLGTDLAAAGTLRLANASVAKCIRMTIDPIGTVTIGPLQATPC